jgi:site-specific DNA-methyltransferase (adenine-specific)
MGSGTTAVACIRNNRKWIGCENNETYFTIANQRIGEAMENKGE